MEDADSEYSSESFVLSSRERAMEQLPCLPKPRPRDLTPLGFRDVGESPQNPPKASFQHCAYYKTPPEIRRYILRLAFGDCRIHMDLSYDYPDIPPDDTQYLDRCHYGIANIELDDEIERIVDESKPKSWHWWGSICHRLPPNLDMVQVGPMTRGGPDGPWADHCRVGQAKHCHSWPGSMPQKCRISIMGWLTSCRQNYVEGVDVLYSTNTIIMASEMMISSIPQLILPQRLALITSLETNWSLKTRIVDRLSGFLDESDLALVLKTVSVNFPRLRRLYLSLEESLNLTPDHDLSIWHDIFTRLDNFAQHMSSLSEFAVSLPGLLFRPVFEDTVHKKADLGYDYIHSYPQVWRSLDGEMDVIHLPYVDSYPNPPHHLASLDDNHEGYWLLSGSNKPAITSPISHCGTSEMLGLDMWALGEQFVPIESLPYDENIFDPGSVDLE